MRIRELTRDDEIAAAFPLMRELRERIRAESFLSEIQRQQAEGYRLIGGFEEGALVVLAGIRTPRTLARGPHLFVDDLVTSEGVRGKGHGRRLMEWVAGEARRQGLSRVYLDSRATARGFYERLGFRFHTSIPCWLDLAE